MSFPFIAIALFAVLGPYGSQSPCESFAKSSTVFIGTVVGVTTVPRPDRGPMEMRSRSLPPPIRICALRVDETLSGSPGTVVRLIDGEQRGEPRLVEGERYVIYASTDSNGDLPADAYRIRAVTVADAAEDLAYLRALAPGRAAVVGGRVVRLDYDPPRERLIELPVRDVNVVLERDGVRFSARTGADGTFAIRDVPAGQYRVRTTPATDTSSLVDSTVEVPERGCATMQFTVVPHAVVIGRLVDAKGAPIKGVDVMIVPDGRSAVSGNYWVRTTDEAGAFRFEAMPEGRYTLGADIVARAYGPGAYGPVFYPGVQERSGARTIHVGKEGTVDAGRLVLPTAPPTRAVAGRVRTRGALPDRTMILVRNVRAIDGTVRELDVRDSGEFTFEALLGETYVIVARGGALTSRPVRVKVDGHVDGVELDLDASTDR